MLYKGQKIGNLTVLARDLNNPMREYWRCVCACGKEATIRQDRLAAGTTKSCGCLRKANMSRVGKQNARRKKPL